VGRSQFHPYRVYAFCISAMQQFHLLLYAKSYVTVIKPYLSHCKRSHSATDLSTLEYRDYSRKSLKRIVSSSNDKVCRRVRNHAGYQQSFLDQAPYEEIVTQDPVEVVQAAQVHYEEMVAIFDLKYDPRDESASTNIFLPPSPSLSLDYLKRGVSSNYPKHKGDDAVKVLPPTPCIVFLVGGAWGRCNLNFSPSVASSFVKSNIAVIYPSYRGFPDGDIGDAKSNINALMQWILKYGPTLNINPKHVCIIGQSSGAHVGALTVLRAQQEKAEWLKNVRLFCGLSGPYSILDHYQWESRRGVEHVSPMGRFMKGRNNFAFYSPTVIAQGQRASLLNVHNRDPKALERELMKYGTALPRFCMIHSVGDYVVPCSSSKLFTASLRGMGVRAEYIEYKEGNHYDSLFGLCDVENVVFSRMITDITTRVFVSCFEYESKALAQNGGGTVKYLNGKVIGRRVETLEQITEENGDSMTGSVEIEDYEDRDELSDDTSAMQSTESSSAISLDGNGNEMKIEEEPPSPSKEEDRTKKRRRARPSIDITESVHGIKYDESENEESDISDLSDNVVTKRKKVSIDGKTKGQEVCWEDWELFNYEDVSADTSKADEAVELMGNLLKDMDKALEAMSNL